MCISICLVNAGTQQSRYSVATQRHMVEQSGVQVQSLSVVVIGLWYMAYPDGRNYMTAKAKALPHEGHQLLCASAVCLSLHSTLTS